MIKNIVCLLILLNISPVFADFVTHAGNRPNYDNFQSRLKINQPRSKIIGYNSPRRQNHLHTHCPECHNINPYLSENELSILEKYALDKTYRRDSALQRLERLENLSFGAIQEGDLNTRYRNVENAILSRPKYAQKRSVLGNIANYFAGQATGFTPDLMQYNNLGGFSSNPYAFSPQSGYNNHSFEQYSNGIFGGGWGVSGSNFGNGTRIRMLD